MTTEQRVDAYRRQTGRTKLTPKQYRRMNQKIARNVHNFVRSGCGHRAKKCDCPF